MMRTILSTLLIVISSNRRVDIVESNLHSHPLSDLFILTVHTIHTQVSHFLYNTAFHLSTAQAIAYSQKLHSGVLRIHGYNDVSQCLKLKVHAVAQLSFLTCHFTRAKFINKGFTPCQLCLEVRDRHDSHLTKTMILVSLA